MLKTFCRKRVDLLEFPILKLKRGEFSTTALSIMLKTLVHRKNYTFPLFAVLGFIFRTFCIYPAFAASALVFRTPSFAQKTKK